MLRPMPWQTSCVSKPVARCQAKMARQALSAMRPGVHVASRLHALMVTVSGVHVAPLDVHAQPASTPGVCGRQLASDLN